MERQRFRCEHDLLLQSARTTCSEACACSLPRQSNLNSQKGQRPSLRSAQNQLCLPWISVGEWCKEVPHAYHHRDQDRRNDLASVVHFSYHTGTQSGGNASLADGVVDNLSRDKVQDSTRDQSRDQVCRQIVVKETLSVHKVEWEVVASPSDHEEARVSEHTVSNGCISRNINITEMERCMLLLTILDRVDAPSSRQCVG